jgi:hypothetical protein
MTNKNYSSNDLTIFYLMVISVAIALAFVAIDIIAPWLCSFMGILKLICIWGACSYLWWCGKVITSYIDKILEPEDKTKTEPTKDK